MILACANQVMETGSRVSFLLSNGLEGSVLVQPSWGGFPPAWEKM